MIVIEGLTINGQAFVKTYSDNGYMVERDGVRYAEAIDPAMFGRQYTETNEPIEGTAGDAVEAVPEEATEADFIAALQEMGVEV